MIKNRFYIMFWLLAISQQCYGFYWHKGNDASELEITEWETTTITAGYKEEQLTDDLGVERFADEEDMTFNYTNINDIESTFNYSCGSQINNKNYETVCDIPQNYSQYQWVKIEWPDPVTV